MKRKRGNRAGHRSKPRLDQLIKQDKVNPENIDQIKSYKQKVELAEQEAYRKEQYLKKNANGGTIEDALEVNNLLVDTIKAKLAILDKI